MLSHFLSISQLIWKSNHYWFQIMEKIERYDWRVTLRPNFRRMRIVGLWPKGDETYQLNLYSVYSAFIVVTFTWGHAFFQIANIFFTITDFAAVFGMLYVTLSEVLIAMKAYLAIRNMKILKQLLIDVNCDLFQPKNHHQIDVSRWEMKFLLFNSNMFWATAVMAVLFWGIYPFLEKSYSDHPLPFLAWYPWKTDVSPLYEITYAYQVLGTAFSASTAVTVDTLIGAMHMYIGAQFEILADNIRHLFDPEDGDFDYGKKLSRCVEHHKEILKFYEQSLTFSNWIVFGQFFISTLSLGITMYQLTTVKLFSSEFLGMFGYLGAVAVQIFLYCWFGNSVEVKSNKVSYAAFEANWMDASKEDKQLLTIFIERNQRPLKVMALDLFFLNLDTFVKVLRVGYSYCALLNQLSGRQ